MNSFAKTMAEWAGNDDAPGSMTWAEWAAVGVDADTARTGCSVTAEMVRNELPEIAAAIDAISELPAELFDDARTLHEELTARVWSFACETWANELSAALAVEGNMETCYCEKLADGICAICSPPTDDRIESDGAECGCAYCVEGERSGLACCVNDLD